MNLSLEGKKGKCEYFTSPIEMSESLLIKGSQWNGECRYSDGTSYPFSLSVQSVEDDTVSGTIHWKSLNAVTRWLGKVKPNGEFKFREYEVWLQGDV